MNLFLVLFGIITQVCWLVEGDLRYDRGHLVDFRDNCTVGDLTSCGQGECCVKDAVASIPEFHGPVAQYIVECRPLQAEGRLCYLKQDSPFCPCVAGLICDTTRGGLGYPFGHCSKTH